MDKVEKELLLKSAILAGKLMLENGAEMYRVEDTMNRLVTSGTRFADNGVSFVVPTALFMGIKEGKGLRMERSSNRTTNLEKIAEVNQISRMFTETKMSVDELYQELKAIEHEKVTYSNLEKIIASALVSGCMMLLFGGSIHELLPTCVIGSFGYYIYLLLKQKLHVRFIPDFVVSFLIGVLAIIGNYFGIIHDIDMVIIGSIMMLVPGVLFTNAIRDFMAGNSISGAIFMIEALMIGIMIGTGITLAFQFI